MITNIQYQTHATITNMTLSYQIMINTRLNLIGWHVKQAKFSLKSYNLVKTEAKYYVLVIQNSNIFSNNVLLYYRIEVKKLMKLIKKELFVKTYQDKDKSGYLFNLQLIISQFKQI